MMYIGRRLHAACCSNISGSFFLSLGVEAVGKQDRDHNLQGIVGQTMCLVEAETLSSLLSRHNPTSLYFVQQIGTSTTSDK